MTIPTTPRKLAQTSNVVILSPQKANGSKYDWTRKRWKSHQELVVNIRIESFLERISIDSAVALELLLKLECITEEQFGNEEFTESYVPNAIAIEAIIEECERDWDMYVSGSRRHEILTS